jgi:N-acetylglucosaminyldiphosphoundecaprenol N-acetyl-beta-D-mannosaminyltransferase
MKSKCPSSVSLLGFKVNLLSDRDVVALMKDSIDTDSHTVFGNHNSHSLYLCKREPKMREFHAMADYVLIDGMSLILLGRLAGLRLKREHRATSLDFLPLLLPEAVRQSWRIYYLGSRPGVAEKGAEKLRAQYPGLDIRTHDGYFNTSGSSKENREVLDDIKDYSPHILFVGMGMPRQEIWILENRKDLAANVISPCGAHMDYVAGEIPTAPRWLALIYLEWLYRLVSEPRRLWYRYLVEPLFLMMTLTHELAKQALSDLERVGGSVPH